jgi:hypothetical protein
VTPEYHPTFSQIFLDERPLADDSRKLVLTVAHKAQRVLAFTFRHAVLPISAPTKEAG